MDIELITTLPWGKNKDELGKIQVPVASDLHIHYHKRYTLINFLKKCNCCGNRSPYPFTISAIKWRETHTEHKLQDRNSIQGKLVPTEVHVASSGSLPLFKRKKCIVSKVIDQKPTLGGSIQKNSEVSDQFQTTVSPALNDVTVRTGITDISCKYSHITAATLKETSSFLQEAGESQLHYNTQASSNLR